MKSPLFALAALGALLTQACGPNCQETCGRLYQEGGSNCHIERAGRTTSQLLTTCMSECNEALSNPGELGDYDPYGRHATNENLKLETDRQAALWMDCISETACDNLENGYCAPVR